MFVGLLPLLKQRIAHRMLVHSWKQKPYLADANTLLDRLCWAKCKDCAQQEKYLWQLKFPPTMAIQG